MGLTNTVCVGAINKYLPGFIHMYPENRSSKWKQAVKIKNNNNMWVRYYSAFEDQSTPLKKSYAEIWVAVEETGAGLSVRHLTDADRNYLRTKYPWL